ncbi:MAG: hypothetical protein KBS45_00315 [Clostridiales bacterium]|nr:hypothetical protein [Candidatus Coliplasma caballi]
MLYATTVFLANLILAIASIIPAVLRDNRGEVIPQFVVDSLAEMLLEPFAEKVKTPEGIAELTQWAERYKAGKAAEADKKRAQNEKPRK